MPLYYEIEPVRTFASKKNAIATVNKAFAGAIAGKTNYRYFIHQSEEGRFFPVFIGQGSIQAGVHFKFNVID